MSSMSRGLTVSVQYGIRFENNDQAEVFIYKMAEEVARRLSSVDMRGHSITLKIMKRDPTAPVEAPKVQNTSGSLGPYANLHDLVHGAWLM